MHTNSFYFISKPSFLALYLISVFITPAKRRKPMICIFITFMSLVLKGWEKSKTMVELTGVKVERVPKW